MPYCLKRLTCVMLVWLGWALPASGLEQVVLRREGTEIRIGGRLLLEAQDGGLLLEARDGVLWTVPPEELVEHTSNEVPFRPLSQEEMSSRLLVELPAGFSIHQTANYLICYDTSRAYAEWCGALLERLYRAFTNFWDRKGVDLSEPEFPLVAVVFASQKSYTEYSRPELDEAAGSIPGYFSLRTNRMNMYDLTGLEVIARISNRRNTTAQINQILARPEAQQMVATIVHEATHQIAFNCGLHRRYSDCPVWFSEGIAIYFETPDLQSQRGWSGIGVLNRPRLEQFQKYLQRRPADSLRTLIADDQRFRNREHSLDAYAEAWALTYHLIRRHSEEYVGYLKKLSEKKPLMYDDPQTRVREFEEAFGDLEELDTEFLRGVRSLR